MTSGLLAGEKYQINKEQLKKKHYPYTVETKTESGTYRIPKHPCQKRRNRMETVEF